MISFKKTKNGHIYRPEVNFLTKVKNNQLHSLSHLPWKIQVNPSSHLWEIARTKNGEKNNNNNNNKKQYNHYKVFRLKRKTLIIINSRITIRSSVETEDLNDESNYVFNWRCYICCARPNVRIIRLKISKQRYFLTNFE